MRGLTAGPRVGDSGSFTGRALGTLRATLVAAAVASPQALAPATPLAAQSASPLLAPDAPAFDAQRRIHLTRSALYFVPGESESSEEDGVYVLPAPVPWPPDAGARNVTLTVPAGKPLFLLAALAP